MLQTEIISRNLSNYTPFNSENNVVKSKWEGSIWSRRQVRIRIESNGELSIQTVAQNRLAQLASTLLKFFSCHRVKSFGKTVVSYTDAKYLLPSNTAVMLSEKKQAAIFDIQCEKLSTFFLPSYQNLFKLGEDLCEYAISQNGGPKVRQKVLDMNQEILDFLLEVANEFQKDTPPEKLYALLQECEVQVQKICEQYPILLKKFMDECVEDNEEIESSISEEIELPVSEEIDLPISGEIKSPITDENKITDENNNEEIESPITDENPDNPEIARELPVLDDIDIERPVTVVLPTLPLTSKQKFINLLNFANKHVIELHARCQFTSAEWLEKQIQNTIEHFSEKPEDESLIKAAMEILENHLDCTEENKKYLAQLLEVAEDSPYEQKLKELVISDIRKTLTQFSDNFDKKINNIAMLVKDSTDCPWLDSLRDFGDQTKVQTEEYALNHDIYNSRIPGFQKGMHWANSLTDQNNPFIPLEMLNKNELATHKSIVDHHCIKALEYLENETNVGKILNLQPQYQQLISLLPKKLEHLEQNGQYHHFALLQKLKSKHEKTIREASNSISGASSTFYYVEVLENAIADLQKQLDLVEMNPKTDPIEQLYILKQLSSPYYQTLHQELVGKSKKSLEGYIEILNTYQNTLSLYLPGLVESKSELADGLIAIESKVKAKISEAKALIVDYTTRLHGWQIFSSQVLLNDLPPAKLKEYMDKVLSVTQNGIKEITQDAAAIGFKFD
ncbi:MAG TPA: hypothetical protein VGP47_02695 [Parachlamydiaceae bacterium]|nr:hypothetical protein [Parachlamydiaceae bacterium]